MNQGLERLADQRGFVGGAGVFLGGADQLVIEGYGCSHCGPPPASIIVSNDAFCDAAPALGAKYRDSDPFRVRMMPQESGFS